MMLEALDAARLGRHAENVFLFQGRHQACARLCHHALRLDPDEPAALRSLSDLLSGDQVQQSPWEEFSAAVLEYALRPGSPLGEAERKRIQDHLFLAKWSWAFIKRLDGQTTASWEELQNRALFCEESERYAAFLSPVLRRCGSIEQVFATAHTLAGLLGGLLTHQTLGGKAPTEEVFFPDRFVRTPEYDAWLKSETEPYDALERERQKRTKP